jgi:hypothetical protein
MGSVLHMPAALFSLFGTSKPPGSPEAVQEDHSTVSRAEASARFIRACHGQGRRRLASRGLSDHLLQDLGL